MTGLLFIRHAETDMSGTFCGHSDPPINERGRTQVQRLLASLASEAIDEIYSSDLRRAMDTATALAEAFAIPCIVLPELREIDFGEWEGMTWAEIENRDAAYAQHWLASFPAMPAPRGEAFADFEHRVLQQVDLLLRIVHDRRIAVVTHAGVMRVVLCNRMGRSEQEAWELTKPYCCTFAFDGTFALEASR
jgi:alpha-ribazole phosphatase/probable phosphoglycerate mutase